MLIHLTLVKHCTTYGQFLVQGMPLSYCLVTFGLRFLAEFSAGKKLSTFLLNIVGSVSFFFFFS